MTQHYVYSLDTTKCLDLWQKIYQILYLFLWNLTINHAIRFRAGGTGGARARPGGNLPAIQFLVDVKVAFLLQVNPLLQLGTASPLEFWTIRQSCGLHVCLIFLTHLFVCISKTIFFKSRSLVLRFTWYHVIFQTGPRDGVAFLFWSTTTKNALSNFGQ